MDYGSSGAGSSGGSGAGGSGSAGATSGGDSAAVAQQPDTASYGGNIVAGQNSGSGPVILTASEGDRIANSTIALWGVLIFLSLVVMV